MKTRILIIDDDDMMLDALKCMLEDIYEITTCLNSTEGVELYARDKHDIVITDMVMPGTDGLGTIDALMRISKSVKILAISGVTIKEVLLGAADLFGAFHSLTKPFSRAQLLWTLEKMVDEK